MCKYSLAFQIKVDFVPEMIKEKNKSDLDNMDNDADAASELVLQFCEITGCEPGLAAKYLAVNDQQLELAVTLFMENGGTDLVSTAEYKESSGSSSTSRATTTMAAGDSYSSSDAVRAPIAARSGVLVAGGGGGSGGMMDEDDDYYTGHYDTPQAYIRQQQHSSSSSSAAFRLHPSIPTYANQANPFMVRGK